MDQSRDSRDAVDPHQWQPLQDYFAEIIGAGIRLVDAHGAPLTTLSKPHAYCTQVIGASLSGVTRCKDCYVYASRPFSLAALSAQPECEIDTPQPSYYDTCPFFINRLVIPVRGAGAEVLANIVIAPVILGRRRSYAEYVGLTRSLDLGINALVNGIEKVRVFSPAAIAFVAGLVQEAAQHSIEERASGSPVPAVAPAEKRREMRFHVQTILQALFETASEGVEAERGSLMVFDETGTTLKIEMAKGIPQEIVSSTRIAKGEGIAGWVAQEQRPLYITREFTNPRLLPRLHQPGLTASLLMPIQGKGVCLGVLSLSTSQPTHRFTPENIKSIERLTKMVDVTVGNLEG